MLALALTLALAAPDVPWRATLLAPKDVTASRCREAAASGITHVAIDLREPLDAGALASAAAAARASGLRVAAWLEVARDPALADARPEWVASLGAHEDWRARFPQAPPTPPGGAVKAWPWVPIGSAEAFEFHARRAGETLAKVPGGADLVFLSGVQGGPSSCGCGNDLCRWAIDYQVPSTATRDWTDSTMARFVERVEALVAKGTPVVAVVTTECEEVDLPGRDGACCVGVACFRGLCWPAWIGQIAALARKPDRRVGVLALTSAFSRAPAAYSAPGGWVGEIARLFREMPPKYGSPGIPAQRLVAVLESGDAAGLAAAAAAGFGGVVVAEVPLPQSFEPRVVATSATPR